MPSTGKPASAKRAPFPRAAAYTKSFVKDWEKLSRTGRYDMRQLKEAMMLLIANDAPLGPEWFDHPLKGEWADHRECHIGGDFLSSTAILSISSVPERTRSSSSKSAS
jgi:mRNA interferase YafQ